MGVFGRNTCIRLCVLLAAALCALATAAAQNSVAIYSEPDKAAKGTIGSFDEDGITYGSLADLTGELQFAYYMNPTTRKAEITLHGRRIKVTAGNPFVVYTDSGSSEGSAIQMPVGPIYGGNTLFVPLAYFIPILNDSAGFALRYDAGRRTLVIPAPKPKPAFDIAGLSIDQRLNGYLLRVQSSKPLQDCEAWVKPDGWLYITIPGVRANIAKLNSLGGFGIVQSVIAIQQTGSVQLTLKCSKKLAECEIVKNPDGNDLLISVIPAENSSDEIKKQQVQQALDRQRDKWKLDVVVIDAGHGGRDPGTIGPRKTKEKDVTLGIALKLGRMIVDKVKGVKVVYTRDDDSFPELYRRGQIANEAGGKLFISIHCNSMPRKPHPMNGFEIYLLKPSRTADAVAVASRENEVVKLEEGYQERYKEITEENFILVAMAQSAYVRYSEEFAQQVVNSMEHGLPIRNNGIKQAGFYVLVGASMPNVLIETGYLSNRQEEQYLRSTKGQTAIAESICDAVKKYKDEYEKTLIEGTGK